jgi:hypothetical protein
MTRVLSELLGMAQPHFGMAIQQLEQAWGRPSTDIKLTAELQKKIVEKLSALSLDPMDTTPYELYRALEQRFSADDTLLQAELGIEAEMAPREIIAHVCEYANTQAVQQTTLVIKSATARKLLKALPPKKLMKQLRYRSIDSMFKQEQMTHIFAGAFLYESDAWRKKFRDQYTKLSVHDFEQRSIAVSMPTGKRWEEFAKQVTTLKRHVVFEIREMGSIVVFPPNHQIPGLSLMTLLLILQKQNDLVATSSFLKLQQVQPNFGKIVRKVSDNIPETSATFLNQPVGWHVIHKYYARFTHAFNAHIFEPHIQLHDLSWQTPEDMLAKLHPMFTFWSGTQYLFHLKDKLPVSCNIYDVAINYCNQLPFTHRTITYGRQELWQELMLRYLDKTNIEQAISRELQPELVFAEVDPTA